MKIVITVAAIILFSFIGIGASAEEYKEAVISAATIVQSSSGADGRILGVLSIGTRVKIEGEKRDGKYCVDSPWMDGWINAADAALAGDNGEFDEETSVPIAMPENPLNINAAVNRSVAIYEQPDSGSKLVGKAGIGTLVRILEYTTEDFCLVETKSGLLGFASADALTQGEFDFINSHNNKSYSTSIGTIAVPAPEYGILNSNVNIRKHPSRKADILRILRSGTRAAVLENKKNNWCLVETEDGLRGYIRSFCVSAEGKAFDGRIQNNSFVFSENSLGSDQLGTLPKDTYVRIIETTDNGWYKVVVRRARVAYIPADEVQLIDDIR